MKKLHTSAHFINVTLVFKYIKKKTSKLLLNSHSQNGFKTLK